MRIDTLRRDRYFVDIEIRYHGNHNDGGNRPLRRRWRLGLELVANDLTIDGDWRSISNR